MNREQEAKLRAIVLGPLPGAMPICCHSTVRLIGEPLLRELDCVRMKHRLACATILLLVELANSEAWSEEERAELQRMAAVWAEEQRQASE